MTVTYFCNNQYEGGRFLPCGLIFVNERLTKLIHGLGFVAKGTYPLSSTDPHGSTHRVKVLLFEERDHIVGSELLRVANAAARRYVPPGHDAEPGHLQAPVGWISPQVGQGVSSKCDKASRIVFSVVSLVLSGPRDQNVLHVCPKAEHQRRGQYEAICREHQDFCS